MCCGAGGDVVPESVVADVAGRPGDDQVYVVAYFNGVTEEVVGLDEARNRLIRPSSRVPEAADAPLGGTYAVKR